MCQLGVIIGDCPMFRRFYVQKVLCSENICSKGSVFRRFYIQKVLCSEGPMFRRFYVQKVLCSEINCSKGPIFVHESIIVFIIYFFYSVFVKK